MELPRHRLRKTNQKNIKHGKKCNNIVLSWIFNSLTPNIINSVIIIILIIIIKMKTIILINNKNNNANK